MDQPMKKTDLDVDYDHYELEHHIELGSGAGCGRVLVSGGRTVRLYRRRHHRLPRRQCGDADRGELFEPSLAAAVTHPVDVTADRAALRADDSRQRRPPDEGRRCSGVHQRAGTSETFAW